MPYLGHIKNQINDLGCCLLPFFRINWTVNQFADWLKSAPSGHIFKVQFAKYVKKFWLDVNGEEMNQADKRLLVATDEVLHYIWDPLDSAGLDPGTRDDYQFYVEPVFSLLKNDANEAAIADYLRHVVVDLMSVKADAAHQLYVARLLLSWKKAIESDF